MPVVFPSACLFFAVTPRVPKASLSGARDEKHARYPSSSRPVSFRLVSSRLNATLRCVIRISACIANSHRIEIEKEWNFPPVDRARKYRRRSFLANVRAESRVFRLLYSGEILSILDLGSRGSAYLWEINDYTAAVRVKRNANEKWGERNVKDLCRRRKNTEPILLCLGLGIPRFPLST